MRNLLRQLEEARKAAPHKTISKVDPQEELVALLVREGVEAEAADDFAQDLVDSVELKKSKERIEFKVKYWGDAYDGVAPDYEGYGDPIRISISVKVPEQVIIRATVPFDPDEKGLEGVAHRNHDLASWLRDARVKKFIQDQMLRNVTGDGLWWEDDLYMKLKDFVETKATYDTDTKIVDRETGEESEVNESPTPQLDFDVTVDENPKQEVAGGNLVRTYACRGRLMRILWPGDYGYER